MPMLLLVSLILFSVMKGHELAIVCKILNNPFKKEV